ncbi:ROK family transcriptional regulator [Antrihabitans sp. YC2-6]|uniref:ROK family transcriptional regulator n=1 Tax=Antrihabitans sp. YC2-6 TaxID=2799498 RepID=UPI0018F2D9D6|nr:ROK family transcriptional regulator [Antrihabitans sp. YC2-6]MBJ8344335.1 ROK family transcriptional regulator [Antrihabitans sp. YC2-6]
MRPPETASHVGDVLGLFRDLGELSRIEVIERSGLSRSTVNQRLAALLDARLINAVDGGESTGGRPSTRFAFHSERAVLPCVDIGASGFVASVCDLSGTPLRHQNHSVDVWDGPDRVLGLVETAFARLLYDDDEIWGVGVGVPGPVEFASGRVVNPPIMTGWDGFDIAGWFSKRYPGPAIVENDTNSRAVAESRQTGTDNLIALKIGTGIGSGLVFNGQIIRGNEGAAGDIGHILATAADQLAPLPCRCGNVGCVEAYAGGWALIRDLSAAGVDVTSVAEVATLVQQGQMDAVRSVRNAGRVIGEAIASLVSILNPATIVISGQLAACDEILLSGIREKIFQRALPLATRNLQLRRSDLGELAGVTGLALITADRLLGVDNVDQTIATHSTPPAARPTAG